MAEQREELLSDLELLKLSLPHFFNAHRSSFRAKDDSEEEFFFNIDPSLLVDPLKVTVFRAIGEGPNSIVYEGLYESQPVAVKLIDPLTTSEARRQSKERFQREVTLLARAEHENIVKFIGATVKPSMMIITELVRGGSLQRHLRNIYPETLGLEVSIRFALDISRAMEYLHANGIIHRDIKPGNLLLTEDMRRIKIADFGLAREEIEGEMTCEAGTYRWMAPELFSIVPLPRGAKKVYDHRVDVYSFAMVLWVLLTNKVPFRGRSNVMVAYAVAQNERPSVDELPGDIVPLLESCWDPNPDNRLEFLEITDSLTKFLSNGPRVMSPPRLIEMESPVYSTEGEEEEEEEEEYMDKEDKEDEEEVQVLQEDCPNFDNLVRYPRGRPQKKHKSSWSARFLRCFSCFSNRNQ